MPVEFEDRGQALENEYFHRKERELIEKMRAKLADEKPAHTGFSCPKCEGNLKETDFGDIKIDVCDKCSGVWLDPGEMAQIMEKDKDGGGWFGGLFK